nr:hypothetical protein [Tanacetum cinerariifolium]
MSKWNSSDRRSQHFQGRNRHPVLKLERTMTETSEQPSKAADKGKIMLIKNEVINLRDIRPTHIKKTIEVRVYQKWIGRNVRTKEPSNFCWQRYTSKHGSKRYRIPLNFGKYTSIQPIPNDDFPEHYFNFIAYNEVQSKADVSGATLTEPVTQPESRVTRRIIEIQNLDVNLPFVIFNDMAKKIDMDAYAQMPKPVVIAVTSTWVTTRYGDFINRTDALEIQSQPRRTDEEEIMRNRYSIESLLSVNPQHYQSSTMATITCFSPEAHTFVPDCNEVVNAAANKDNRDVPNALKQVENTTYRLEAHSFIPECNALIQGNKNEPSPSTKCTEEALQAMAEERKKKVKHKLFP